MRSERTLSSDLFIFTSQVPVHDHWSRSKRRVEKTYNNSNKNQTIIDILVFIFEAIKIFQEIHSIARGHLICCSL